MHFRPAVRRENISGQKEVVLTLNTCLVNEIDKLLKAVGEVLGKGNSFLTSMIGKEWMM